jgi:dynein light chain Tctex-type 1
MTSVSAAPGADTKGGIVEVWSSEELEKAISDEVDLLLKDVMWDETQAAHWNNKIAENLLARLVDSRRAYKYAVDVCVLQKTGAGLHSATATFVDIQNDAAVSYLWPKEKSKDTMNKAVVCLVTVFAAAL